MFSYYKRFSIHLLFLAFAACTFPGCKKFLELGAPPTQTVLEEVFKTDATATSAVLGLYSSGSSGVNSLVLNFSVYPGMSADEVQLNTSNLFADEFKTNSISAANNNVNMNNIWYPAYQVIKNANNAIAGLSASTTLTPAVKDQLLGEAKFIRAYAYFYLVNLYGDVPMPLTGDVDYLQNAQLPRSPAAGVWAQVITDLKDAQAMLPAAYAGTFRARVNKWAAAAMLARAYLYNKDYANAEAMASQVIGSGVYSLPAPTTSFINTSNEIIWQVANTTGVSTFGANYLAASGIPTYYLYDTLYKSFEAADLRKANWTGMVTVGGQNYYTINKYKVRAGTGNEYNIVLRLAEVYLIRAEARAQQNNLSGAKADIEMVRTRAGLGGLPATVTQQQLLLAIEQERKVELFGEWGHRWLDLKRTDRANAVIGGIKSTTWNPTDVLYPIPEPQRLVNPNLTQNPGY
ncbi:RagB/SusD family nutrient uptake outer membrane protein [Segetibacter sp. 3557_3]|uniref:RagB/SusD family nutrient uptake outer membrane protein n=1 Tax=Segetibacter sp. 3557_3 TaxID=2547429 RepID=UPI001058CAA1|nr:RagB/SusD family nutrient uptake outer membrane protein [Segetibacter sp. 3557_3]TDH27045.1 RagB/SusD family nutrient uptake outer membrane protein [Segetibacter sp. 3557_3]